MSVHQWYNGGPGQDYSAGWKPLLCSLTSHHLLVQNGAPLEHKPIRLQSLLHFSFFFSVSRLPFLCHGSWNACGGPRMGESLSSDPGTTSCVVVSAQHSVAATSEDSSSKWVKQRWPTEREMSPSLWLVRRLPQILKVCDHARCAHLLTWRGLNQNTMTNTFKLSVPHFDLYS